jgi:5'-3' exonuclease
MGVKGLFQFFKRFEKEIHIPTYIKNKRVAVDIFWYIYKSKGNIFDFQYNISNIVKNAKEVYCVFDGSPPESKYEQLRERAEKRKEILNSIYIIEEFMRNPFKRLNSHNRYIINTYLEELKRQSWTPTPEYINEIKYWLLNYNNCRIINAKEEADDELIQLEKNGAIDLIITNDSDLLVLGSSLILRQYTIYHGGIIEKEYIKQHLNFTEIMWVDFMYLCRKMKNADIDLIYSYISIYKDISCVIEKCDLLRSQDNIEDVVVCP